MDRQMNGRYYKSIIKPLYYLKAQKLCTCAHGSRTNRTFQRTKNRPKISKMSKKVTSLVADKLVLPLDHTSSVWSEH